MHRFASAQHDEPVRLLRRRRRRDAQAIRPIASPSRPSALIRFAHRVGLIRAGGRVG